MGINREARDGCCILTWCGLCGLVLKAAECEVGLGWLRLEDREALRASGRIWCKAGPEGSTAFCFSQGSCCVGWPGSSYTDHSGLKLRSDCFCLLNTEVRMALSHPALLKSF